MIKKGKNSHKSQTEANYLHTHLSLISSYLWFKEDVEHHGEPKEKDKED